MIRVIQNNDKDITCANCHIIAKICINYGISIGLCQFHALEVTEDIIRMLGEVPEP
jgi:hypothetical protein